MKKHSTKKLPALFEPRERDRSFLLSVVMTTTEVLVLLVLMIGMGDMMGGMDDEGAVASQPKPKEKKKCKGPFGVSVPCPF